MGEKNSGVTHPSPRQDLWLPFPKPPVMDLGEQPRSPQEPGACSAWGLDAAPDNGPGFISSRILG